MAVTNAELSPLLKLSTDCLSTFIITILDNNVDLPSVTGTYYHYIYVVCFMEEMTDQTKAGLK